MKAKYLLIILPLLTVLTSCNYSMEENRVEETPEKIDYTYSAEVQLLLNSSMLTTGEGDDNERYTEKGFSELILSPKLFDKTCHEIGAKSEDVQNEIILKNLPNTDIMSITVNGVDTLSSKIFLEKLMELTEDSIVQSIIQPMDDSLAILESAIFNEMSMINEVDLFENDYQKSTKLYTKLVEQRTELMIRRSGVIPRILYVDWWFREI